MRLTHLTKIAAVAGAIVAPLAMAGPASATAEGSGSAFGISASGLVDIPPTPAVASSSKQPSRASLAELPANPLVEAGVLKVEAWAGHGRAYVADAKVAQAGLSAKLIFAKCQNGNGVSHLGKVVVNGQRLKVSPKPNSAISVNLAGVGAVDLVLNKQVRNPDGGITVTAIEATVAAGEGKIQTVSIASVTCSPATSTPPTEPSPAPTTSTPPGEAPAPTPVQGDLPVTG